MKKSRFSEDQIIGILKEQRAAWDQRRNVLNVAVAIRRDGGLGRPSTEDARRGEPQAEEA